MNKYEVVRVMRGTNRIILAKTVREARRKFIGLYAGDYPYAKLRDIQLAVIRKGAVKKAVVRK